MPSVHRDANVCANVIYYAPQRLEHGDSACIPFKLLLESLELQGKGTRVVRCHGAPRPHRHNFSGWLRLKDSSGRATSTKYQQLASSAACLETQEMRHAISHDINNDEYWPAHDCLGPLGDSMSHLLDGILQFLNLLFLSSAHLSSLPAPPTSAKPRPKQKQNCPRWSKFDQPERAHPSTEAITASLLLCAMSRAILLVFFAACCVGCTYAFTSMMPAPQLRSPALSASGRPAPASSTSMQMESADRRGVLLAGVAALSSAVIPAPAKAADEVTFYVGAGCYWHVQVYSHESEKTSLPPVYPEPFSILLARPMSIFASPIHQSSSGQQRLSPMRSLHDAHMPHLRAYLLPHPPCSRHPPSGTRQQTNTAARPRPPPTHSHSIGEGRQRLTHTLICLQHEVTEAEKKILGRKELEYTAVVGYGGGTKTGKNGKVTIPHLPHRTR